MNEMAHYVNKPKHSCCHNLLRRVSMRTLFFRHVSTDELRKNQNMKRTELGMVPAQLRQREPMDGFPPGTDATGKMPQHRDNWEQLLPSVGN